MPVPFLSPFFAEIQAPSGLDALLHAPLPVMIAAGVVVLLFLICFLLILAKTLAVSKIRKMNAAFLRSYKDSAHPLAILQNGERHGESTLSRVYLVGSRELAFHLLGTDAIDKDFLTRLRGAGKIVPFQMQPVREALQREVIECSQVLVSKIDAYGGLVRLAAWLAALTPFIAALDSQLFASRNEPAASPTAFLVSLAPVALALVAAAICLYMLQLLSITVGRQKQALASFALDLSVAFDRNYVDFRQPMGQLPSISSFGPPDSPSFSLPPSDSPLPSRIAPAQQHSA
jgi:hypothetical protein